jgi:hypothetical protein
MINFGIVSSKLPEELEKKILKYLAIDQTVYVVPWAINVDLNGDMFINTLFGYTLTPLGTSSMKITVRKDHIEVYKNTIDFKYRPEKIDNYKNLYPVVLTSGE